MVAVKGPYVAKCAAGSPGELCAPSGNSKSGVCRPEGVPPPLLPCLPPGPHLPS